MGSTPKPTPAWETLGYGSEEEYQTDMALQRLQQQIMYEKQMEYMMMAQEQAAAQTEAMARQAEIAEQAYLDAQARYEAEEAKRAEEEAAREAEEKRRMELFSGQGARPTLLTGGQGVQLTPEQRAENLGKKKLGGEGQNIGA